MHYSQQFFLHNRDDPPPNQQQVPEVSLEDQIIDSDDAWTVIKAYF